MAQLHDGSEIEVSVFDGGGPAILLPVRTAILPGPQAEQMRAWGADPDTGRTLAKGLADAGLRVVAADYEGHLAEHPKPSTLTADAVAADLLAIAGDGPFAYYGYSWLALAGLQLAIRTERLAALVMGGFPPLGGPYAEMLAVTRAAHRMAVTKPRPQGEVTPGDWDSVEVTVDPAQTAQYVTLYESLQDFDERAALEKLGMPRMAFAGENDNIEYGAKWGNVRVPIADALREHQDTVEKLGWSVAWVPGADHMTAMQADVVLPLLNFLRILGDHS
jgi:pimeloyl-ACP methyl ester carboxylesterase